MLPIGQLELGKPLRKPIEILACGLFKRCVRLMSEIVCVEAITATEGAEHQFRMLLRAITTGECREDRSKPNGKQWCRPKLLLMTEQVQLNQQLISDSAVQRGDDIGELLMKCAFAVSNGLTVAQVLFRNECR